MTAPMPGVISESTDSVRKEVVWMRKGGQGMEEGASVGGPGCSGGEHRCHSGE